MPVITDNSLSISKSNTIEDNVTIYSGASILGGNTVIGKGSVIGGNVFLTRSIPPGTKVYAVDQELRFDGPEGSAGPFVWVI